MDIYDAVFGRIENSFGDYQTVLNNNSEIEIGNWKVANGLMVRWCKGARVQRFKGTKVQSSGKLPWADNLNEVAV